jgi:hypothetical protein
VGGGSVQLSICGKKCLTSFTHHPPPLSLNAGP